MELLLEALAQYEGNMIEHPFAFNKDAQLRYTFSIFLWYILLCLYRLLTSNITFYRFYDFSHSFFVYVLFLYSLVT